ncbi:hypothetical protein [Paenibacillus sp. SYP-B4298]|uniref:hypothetical protein n=1 Tax=Paenibacillus sp. SYP-B4298 TaxID=2996034 RepID=UPI0022DDEB00|nr:hypothetical protein [Paenibacillus sp. SYP-B4298]
MKKKLMFLSLIAMLLLSLSIVPASAALPDYYEPNNTYDTAYTIYPNQAIATILSSDQDRDYYKFTTGYVGNGKFIDVSLLSPSRYYYSLNLTTYPGGYVQKYQLDDGSGNFSSYRVPLQSYTTYYILVSKIGGSITTDANYFLMLGNIYE